MMKVLYLSYDGMTDGLGQSQVLPYLRTLSKKGCSFHIISLEKEARFHRYKSEIRELCEAHNIQWHPLAYDEKVPVLSAFQNYRRLKKHAITLQKRESFDIVHCRSDIPALIGAYFQRRFKTRFIFDMRGFWADERVEGGIWNTSNPVFAFLYRFFKKKETQLFKTADATISLTKKGKDVIHKMPSLKNHNVDVTVIPCCVDLDLFHPSSVRKEDQESLRNELNISSSTRVFGYLGSIGTWYMLDEMLRFYAEQRKKEDASVFLFVSGESRENIVKKAKKLHIPKDEIIVKSSIHHEVPLHISLFDISVFFIRPTFSKSASSPTKQGELMAMQVPIVCNAGVGDTDEIIRKFKAGEVVEKMTSESFRTLSMDHMDFDPKLAREGAESWYSLENGANRYLEVYQRIKSK